MSADNDCDDDDESVNEAEQLSQTNARVPVTGTNNGVAGELFIDRARVWARVKFS